MLLKKHMQKGFTLLEVLLVVAAISILASIVIIAINPSKQLGDTRNAQRKADINTILNAVYQYSLDNNGTLPAGLAGGGCLSSMTSAEVCKTGAALCTGITDLSVLTTSEKYIVSAPLDPSGGYNANGTGYFVIKDANNRITVCAPKAENTASISATR